MPSASADELIEVDEFLGDAPMGLQLLQLLHQIGVRVHTNLLLHDIVTESQGKLTGVLFAESATPVAGSGEAPRQQPLVRRPRVQKRRPFPTPWKTPLSAVFQLQPDLPVL